MANMSLTKNIMPMQDPKVRAHNFNEVAIGYSFEVAKDEAERCLNCKNKVGLELEFCLVNGCRRNKEDNRYAEKQNLERRYCLCCRSNSGVCVEADYCKNSERDSLTDTVCNFAQEREH